MPIFEFAEGWGGGAAGTNVGRAIPGNSNPSGPAGLIDLDGWNWGVKPGALGTLGRRLAPGTSKEASQLGVIYRSGSDRTGG